MQGQNQTVQNEKQNVTTIIKLTNLINNTNIVHVPTSINNTNINNINFNDTEAISEGILIYLLLFIYNYYLIYLFIF